MTFLCGEQLEAGIGLHERCTGWPRPWALRCDTCLRRFTYPTIETGGAGHICSSCRRGGQASLVPEPGLLPDDLGEAVAAARAADERRAVHQMSVSPSGAASTPAAAALTDQDALTAARLRAIDEFGVRLEELPASHRDALLDRSHAEMRHLVR